MTEISLRCHGNPPIYICYRNHPFFCAKKLKPVLGYNLKLVWTNRLRL